MIAVNGLQQGAPGDGRGEIVLAPHPLDRLTPGQLQPIGVEAGPAQHVGQQAETGVEVAAAQGEVAGGGIAVGGHRQIGGDLLESGVEGLRGVLASAAGAQRRGKQPPLPGAVGRIADVPGREHGGNLDQGQLVVFLEIEPDTAGQGQLFDLRAPGRPAAGRSGPQVREPAAGCRRPGARQQESEAEETGCTLHG